MSEPVQISIVIPVFNASAHLASMMSSLLGQTEQSLEIIAVDDGSTDDSLSMLREFARNDARVVVLHQENRGPSAARNRGIARATGRWITFADSDDWLSPGALARWRSIAEAGELDLLIGNAFRFIDHPHERANAPAMFTRQPWGKVLSGTDWIVHAVAQNEWPHFVWLQFIRHDFLKARAMRFADGLMHEDIEWTTQLALAAPRMGFANEPLYGYRTCASSITNCLSHETIGKRASSYLVIMRALATASANPHSSTLLKKALLRHAGREGSNFYGLVRKTLFARDLAMCGELATEFFRGGLWRVMFRGAATHREVWRAVRCQLMFGGYLLRVSKLGRASAVYRRRS